MPRTPQRFPGQNIEEDSYFLEDRGNHTGQIGTLYRVGDDIYAHDGSGSFSLRQGAADVGLLEKLIITSSGGIVYSSNGELILKETI